MTTASNLPVELHAEILQNLHHYRDRHTLLSTALVCTDWCALSQRILFSAVSDHSYDTLSESAMSTHIRFLQTITEYPHRLGPLVRSYAQNALSCNQAASWFSSDVPQKTVELWRLMEKALPEMVNLKHLHLDPYSDSRPARDDWVSYHKLLNSFTFQLKTLTWKYFFHAQNGVPEFLATQHDLIHLENGKSGDCENLSWLDNGVCPNLKSVSCDFHSFSHVARTRTIIAWKWLQVYEKNDADLVDQSSLILDPLKYISVDDYNKFRRIIGPINLNIVLLELRLEHWHTDAVNSLANLPFLRVLVLTQDRRDIIKLPNWDKISMQDVVDCFQRLSSLEYRIHRFSLSSRDVCRYVKLSLSPDSPKGILREESNIHYDLLAPWWTLYNL